MGSELGSSLPVSPGIVETPGVQYFWGVIVDLQYNIIFRCYNVVIQNFVDYVPAKVII